MTLLIIDMDFLPGIDCTTFHSFFSWKVWKKMFFKFFKSWQVCDQVEAGPIFSGHWIPYLFFPDKSRYHRIFTLSGLFRTCQAPDSAAEVDPIAHLVEAQRDCGPGSEIGANWKIGVTWSRKRSFKMAATELGYLLTKSPFWLSLWHDISISWHGGKEL